MLGSRLSNQFLQPAGFWYKLVLALQEALLASPECRNQRQHKYYPDPTCLLEGALGVQAARGCLGAAGTPTNKLQQELLLQQVLHE